MSDLDERIRAAVRAGARAPVEPDVMASVASKRVHRRVVRRVELGAVAIASIVAIVALSLVALNPGDDPTTHVATRPAPSTLPKVRVVDGAGRVSRAQVHFVALDPDEGFVRGPLLLQGDIVTAAAYDRAGDSYTVPPSRIVRFTLDGHVVDRVDLQGAIVSLASGEGARWALTHDKEVSGPQDPEFRVKRVAADGRVTSNPVPPGEQPNGDIVAAGGGVWVPVTDGVLRFDVTTGAFAGRVPLPAAKDRAVALGGKLVVATDGASTVPLTPDSNSPGAPSPVVSGRVARLVDVASTSGQLLRLGVDAGGTRGAIAASATFGADPASDTLSLLSDDFRPTAIDAIGDVAWVSGAVGDEPAAALVPAGARCVPGDCEAPTVHASVVFERAADLSFAFPSRDQAVLLADGHVYRVDLRE